MLYYLLFSDIFHIFGMANNVSDASISVCIYHIQGYLPTDRLGDTGLFVCLVDALWWHRIFGELPDGA